MRTTLALLLAMMAASAHARPDILLVVSDDQQPGTLHALGNAVIETPVLDRLITTGTTFTRAYAGYPICYASRAQILTGCHIFRAFPKYPASNIDPQLATMAGTLQAAGYHTCYTGKWHNDGHPMQRGYAITSGLYSSGGARNVLQPEVDERGRPLTGYRGWTFKDAANKPDLAKGVGLQPDNSRHIADAAIHAMRNAPQDKPWLIHVNFAFPHDPRQWPAGMKNHYDAAKMPLPASFAPKHPFDHGNIDGRDETLLPVPRDGGDVRAEIAIYYAMITDLDTQLGRIISALPHPENTVILFTSDQGLALGGHGLIGKQNQYEHSIRSPFIISGPGLPKNERNAALIELRDIFPTLCDLADIPVPDTVQAKSLMPLLRHQTDHIHDHIFGVFTDTQRMICDTRWKFVLYPKADRQQLFDLQNDPDELHDLSTAPEHAEKRQEMQNRLQTVRQKHHDPSL
jgi:arylsulfatase A-like enzyme